MVGSGTSDVGYQPVVTQANIGLFAEVTPYRIDQQPDDSYRITLRTALTEMESKPDSKGDSEIDRFEISNQSLESVVLCPAGRPVIAGSLSARDKDAREVMVIIGAFEQ